LPNLGRKPSLLCETMEVEQERSRCAAISAIKL
jgi:hypothetical protein